MRFVELNVERAKINEFRNIYSTVVIERLHSIPGCRFAGLIESSDKEDEYISLTLWDNQEHAEEYEKSGVYNELLEKIKPYLQNSSEWKIQLSENMELEYKPVIEEPEIKKYSVQVQSDSSTAKNIDSKLYVRIVSLSIQNGKENDFKKLYNDEIIPALLSMQGCRYAYLTQSIKESNSFISVTIWDKKEDADFYDKSGKFKELIDKASSTFSQIYRWKMALEKDFDASIKTSEDVKVGKYNIVTGKNFI
jgi:quinol monooxygenase YgiN